MYMVILARQISVSEEVYELLLRRKGKKSFSQVIKENLSSPGEREDIRNLAGILRDDRGELDRLKSRIAEERERNTGREYA